MRATTSLSSLTILIVLFLFGLSVVTAENPEAASQMVNPVDEGLLDDLKRGTFDNGSVFPPVAQARVAIPPVPCPSPTDREGNQCVLKRDEDIYQAIVLPSNTALDCKGHRLEPKGKEGEFSKPQVGLFLANVRGVFIQNCDIRGFDFGVFAINSRPAPPLLSFLLWNNKIIANYTGVSLMGVDRAQILSNEISYTQTGGRALYIGRDSDSNGVSYNTFVADLDGDPSDARAFRVPGRASTTVNPVVDRPGGAVIITTVEGPEPSLLNAVVDGRLFQIRTSFMVEGSSAFSEGNKFTRNTIRFRQVPVDGVVLATAQRTELSNNTIEAGGRNAIRLGLQTDDRLFAGRCPQPGPPRFCLANEQCDLAACQSVTTQKVLWLTNDTLIEGNVVKGPFGSGINSTGRRTIIRGNNIVGPLRDPTLPGVAGAGIRLGGFALETATVTRNSVSKVQNALTLFHKAQGVGPSQFLAKISLNDFTGYTNAVVTASNHTSTQTSTTDIYNLLTELSSLGRGNYWGTPGCTGLRPLDVKMINGNANAKVTDKNPFRLPVANSSILSLPCTIFGDP